MLQSPGLLREAWPTIPTSAGPAARSLAYHTERRRACCAKPGLQYAAGATMADTTFVLNAERRTVSSASDTPLLYVLTDELALQGPRFGCGLGQCGSCSVLVNDAEVRSCQTMLSAVAGKSVTTLEGLPAWYAAKRKLTPTPALHPIQQALVDEQALQCGYCFNGMIIKAAELLSRNPQPSESQIRTAMNGHLCRCGTYPRVARAIRRAANAMAANA
jgi:aerobic-type carbon monoxide dehydrogenase small subunit (CoxS/CutS family)